ncbi:MAG: 4Fe-4S binding protein [Bacillota bacterium]
MKVQINEGLCKGCELCVAVCPKKILRLSDRFNRQGYHPAEVTDEQACISCTFCALMCPDVAIAVCKESRGNE